MYILNECSPSIIANNIECITIMISILLHLSEYIHHRKASIQNASSCGYLKSKYDMVMHGSLLYSCSSVSTLQKHTPVQACCGDLNLGKTGQIHSHLALN